MEFKTFDDVVKQQQAFTSALAHRLQLLKESRVLTPDALREEKRTQLKEAKGGLSAARRQRDETVKRLEASLQRRETTLKQLEDDLGALEKAGRPDVAVTRTKAARVKPAASAAKSAAEMAEKPAAKAARKTK